MKPVMPIMEFKLMTLQLLEKYANVYDAMSFQQCIWYTIMELKSVYDFAIIHSTSHLLCSCILLSVYFLSYLKISVHVCILLQA